jgi:hypothetical protein
VYEAGVGTGVGLHPLQSHHTEYRVSGCHVARPRARVCSKGVEVGGVRLYSMYILYVYMYVSMYVCINVCMYIVYMYVYMILSSK